MVSLLLNLPFRPCVVNSPPPWFFSILRAAYLWKYQFTSYTNDWSAKSTSQWHRLLDRLYGTRDQPELLEIGSVLVKHDKRNKDKDRDYDVPRYIQKKIRTQDLKTAFLNMFWYINHFRNYIGNNVSYSPMELAASVPFYAHPSRACPTTYLIRIKNEKATLYIPKLKLSDCISDLDFFYAPTFETYENQPMQDALINYDM